MPEPTTVVLMSRLFTLKSANAFVPRLSEIFRYARGLLARMQTIAGAMAEEGHPIEDVESVEEDPEASPLVRRYQLEIIEIVAELKKSLSEVHEMGAEVKSADGLVDFRSRRKGEVVCLCWRWGEEAITHWHDMASGFSGRAPIADAAEFEGDLLQ